MKIRTQLSTSAQAIAVGQGGEAPSGAFAGLLHGAQLDAEPGLATADAEAAQVGPNHDAGDRTDEPDDDVDDTLASLVGATQTQPRPTQAPLRVTLYWNTQPADPRREGVRATGSTDLGTHTLTTRESGPEARGLRSGAVPPGGAGTDSTPGSLGTVSDSREVPLPDVIDVPDDLVEAPTHQVERPSVQAAATQTNATASRDDADDAANATETLSVEGDALGDTLPDPDAPDTIRTRLDGAAASSRAESPTASATAKPEATPTAQPEPTDVPDLPPRALADGPVRVAIDDDLALEVTADEHGVDVTLEGDDDAVRPLTDVGPELEEELARHGWDLRQFGSRRDRQAATTQHHAGTAVVEEETPSETPANRVLRRGKLVDTLA